MSRRRKNFPEINHNNNYQQLCRVQQGKPPTAQRDKHEGSGGGLEEDEGSGDACKHPRGQCRHGGGVKVTWGVLGQ